MKLLTKELEKKFKKYGRQEVIKEPVAIAKFFNPTGSGTWYATEYYPKEKKFFGYVTGLSYNEWGYFSLKELETVELPFGLKIERDLYFEETPIREIIENEKS